MAQVEVTIQIRNMLGDGSSVMRSPVYCCCESTAVEKSNPGLTSCRVFFYPPLGYAYVVWRTKSSHGDVERVGDDEEEGVDRAERSPLLSRNSGRVLG